MSQKGSRCENQTSKSFSLCLREGGIKRDEQTDRQTSSQDEEGREEEEEEKKSRKSVLPLLSSPPVSPSRYRCWRHQHIQCYTSLIT